MAHKSNVVGNAHLGHFCARCDRGYPRMWMEDGRVVCKLGKCRVGKAAIGGRTRAGYTVTLDDVERGRRVKLADKEQRKVRARARSKNWTYTAHVSPMYLSDDNTEFRIKVQGTSRGRSPRMETLDLATLRARYELYGQLLKKFDDGEIKNPW